MIILESLRYLWHNMLWFQQKNFLSDSTQALELVVAGSEVPPSPKTSKLISLYLQLRNMLSYSPAKLPIISCSSEEFTQIIHANVSLSLSHPVLAAFSINFKLRGTHYNFFIFPQPKFLNQVSLTVLFFQVMSQSSNLPGMPPYIFYRFPLVSNSFPSVSMS